MRVTINQNKLEDTLVDLNNDGYTVVKSLSEGDDFVLVAKKIRISCMHDFNMDTVPEHEPVEIFNKKHKPFNSIWNGLKMKWLNFKE